MSEPMVAVLMRNDMDSLNPGKACAQANHASNALHHQIECGLDKHDSRIKGLYQQWRSMTTQGFGTVLVYACKVEMLGRYTQVALDNRLVSGHVIDPSYPVRDGKVTHSIDIITCSYIFGPSNDVLRVVGNLELMP